MLDPLLHRKEAAKFLNCRPQLLEEWATAGRGPTFIKNGRWVRYRQSDLLAFVEQNARRTVNRRKVLIGEGVSL